MLTDRVRGTIHGHHFMATEWDPEEGPSDERCMDCDCRPYSRAAQQECPEGGERDEWTG